MSEPTWPTSRGVERYEALGGVDIASTLEQGGIWIDVGPGIDARPMQPFLHRPDVSLVCVGMHPRDLPAAIEFHLGAVPHDVATLERYAGRARLVTDIYASVSYADDPLLALAYCVLLLEPGGVCAAFTELRRLGGLATWDRAIQGFRAHLGASLHLEAMPILEDASQSMATALRIRAFRTSSVRLDFADVARLLQAQIGTPIAGEVIWQASDGSASIRQVDYR